MSIWLLALVLLFQTLIAHAEPGESVETSIEDVEANFLKQHKQLIKVRKTAYQTLCQTLISEILDRFSCAGLTPDETPASLVLDNPLTLPSAYQVTVIDACYHSKINIASSSWCSHPDNKFALRGHLRVVLPGPTSKYDLEGACVSRNELQAVLAHEVGHLWKFHKQAYEQFRKRSLSSYKRFAGLCIGACIAGITWRIRGKPVRTPEWYPLVTTISDVTAMCSFTTTLLGTCCYLFKRGCQRLCQKQELEADQFVFYAGEETVEQFLKLLTRWYLLDRLCYELRRLDATSWIERTWVSVKSLYTRLVLSPLSSHPSPGQRIYELLQTWLRTSIETQFKALPLEQQTEEAFTEISNAERVRLLKQFHTLLETMPEIDQKWLSAVCTATFNITLTTAEHAHLVLSLAQIAVELYSLAENALAQTAPAWQSKLIAAT